MEPPTETPKSSEGAEPKGGGEAGDDSTVSPLPTPTVDKNPTPPSQPKPDEELQTDNGTETQTTKTDEKEEAEVAQAEEEADQGKTSDTVQIPVKPGGVQEEEKDRSDSEDDKTETENGNGTAQPLDMDVEKPIAAEPQEDNKRVKSEQEEEEEEEEEEAEEVTLTENESKIKNGNGNRSLEKDENEKAVGDADAVVEMEMETSKFDYWSDGNESGDEEDQGDFMKELEKFHKENNLEFKPPKFYGVELNLLKLWRHVIKLGCYEKVTSQKLWRQVGESFNPPKTCTTVSWTFRIFYEKALLEYEKYKIRNGDIEAEMPDLSAPPIPLQVGGNEAMSGGGSGSGRARRDAATRAMEGWHSHRPLGNGQVSDPFIKSGGSLSKRDKFVKTSGGSLKRKKPEESDNKMAPLKADKSQMDVSIIDAGLPADWVKINVKKNKDCYEVYALVPGLLREEVQVKSDPAGRLIVSGEPEQPDNPWGVTPFKKVITLPSPIDPHQTSAVVTLHGQLYVRAPFPSPTNL